MRGRALLVVVVAARGVGCGHPAPQRPARDPLADRFPLAALDDRALCDRLLARTAADHAVLVDDGPAPRRMVIVSDLHLGPGTADSTYAGIEDFLSDAAWTELLHAQAEHGPTELVIAGDFIEFWQIASVRGDLPAATGDVQPAGAVLAADQDASLAELAPVLAAHAGVFRDLGAFLAAGDNRVVVVAGNHDADLLWPKVQLAIARAIAPRDPARLVFVDARAYEHAGVHVEHGHELDAANKPATGYAPFGRDAVGRCRLQASWGEVFVDRFYTQTERELPFIDNLYPVSAGVLWGMRDEPEPARDLGAVLRFLELIRRHETAALDRDALGGLVQDVLGMPGASERGPGSMDEVLDHVADQMTDGDPSIEAVTDALLELRYDPALATLWPGLRAAARALPDVRTAFAALRGIDPAALSRLNATLLGDTLATGAAKILAERPGISIVVFGHTHEVGGSLHRIDHGAAHGYYVNSGSWLSVASVAALRARGVRFAELALDPALFPAKTTAVIVDFDGQTATAPVLWNAP